MDKPIAVYPCNGIILDTKRNEGLTHGTTWMDPENTKLSERRQSRKVTYPRIPFLRNTQNTEIHKSRVQIGGYQALSLILLMMCRGF